MKKIYLYMVAAVIALPMTMAAQGAIDIYNISQNDLRGTARFSSMAGSFGALGGDISTLVQNPAGIGVYRSSDLAVTLDFNAQSSKSTNAGITAPSYNNFVFSCNNAGYVGAFNTGSDLFKTFNYGFSYNRAVSFNRRSRGKINDLNTSMTNYIAGVTTAGNLTLGDLKYRNDYEPYDAPGVPWLSILAFDSNMITPDSRGESWQGLLGDGTTGYGEFETVEQGGVDEYSINWGGNIADKVYWGMGFGINDINYNSYTYYGEALNNAYIADDNYNVTRGTASWGIVNRLNTSGTGYNFKMGLIFKPVNELRLGFAFHTPTYYSLRDQYIASTAFAYANGIEGDATTNGGYVADTYYRGRTPWKFIASAAIVAPAALINFDYEYIGYQTMKVLDDGGWEYADVTANVQNYFRPSSIFRVGGEYRLTQNVSARLGYSYQTSPVQDIVYNNGDNIMTSGTNTSYNFMKSQQYVTAGIGYHGRTVYFDLAYVHKTRKSEFHAFSPVVYSGGIEPSPSAQITENNDRIVATVGFRF